jgi:predicted cobalt transporter CbtA
LGAGTSAAFIVAAGLPFIAMVGTLSLIIDGLALIVAPREIAAPFTEASAAWMRRVTAR